MPSTLPKGFLPFHNIDGAKAVVLPAEDGKRSLVVWVHTGPLSNRIEKNGFVELGPRHEVSLKAWAGTKAPEAPKPEKPVVKATAKKAPAKKAAAPKVKAAPVTAEDGHRGRGRPRKDGLLPGSYEVGVLNHAHETRTAVPQEILDKMAPEARLVEEARNRKITEGSAAKPVKAAKVTHISTARAKKAKAATPAASPTGKRKLIRRARG